MFKATLGQIDPRLVPTDIHSLSKVVGKFEPPADRARNRHSLGSTGTTPDEGRQEGEGTVAWRGRAKEGRGADLVKPEVLEIDEEGRGCEAKA